MISATEFDHFFATMIEAVLDNSDHKQFIFSLSIRGDYFTSNEKEYIIPCTDLHYLIDARSNYIGVWLSTIRPNIPRGTGIKSVHEVKESEWVFQAKHDSCWRGDGLKQIYLHLISMRDELAKKLPKKFDDENKLNIVRDKVRITTGLTFCRKVSFDSKRDPNQHYSYLIENLKFI